MKKYLRIILMCFLAVFAFLMSDYKEVSASTNTFSTVINLDESDNQAAFDFNMPRDGKIRLDINVKDKGGVPGTLTFAIQTGYSNSSEKIKEITGITSTNGVNGLEIELTKGRYFFHYELSGADENTVLGLSCDAEILSTIPDNLSALSVHNINSFDDITDNGYEEIYFGGENKQADLVLPFEVDKTGGILIALQQADFYNDLEAGIYQDKECTKPVDKKFLLNDADDFVNIERTIPEKGTYYIKFTCKYENPNGVTNFKVKIYSISGEERTLSDGDTTVAYQASGEDKIIYKINVKKTKLFKFIISTYETPNNKGAYFRLLDKNKKKLTDNSYVISQQYDDLEDEAIIKYYTMNKGTYYLEVNADCSIYQLQIDTLDVSKQAGSSKAKAKLLKINGNATDGYFTISDKTSKVDWYKFSVAKSGQYINLTIVYMLDGDMKFQILDSKGKIMYDSSKETEWMEGYYYHWLEKTYSKGTYYVKVFKGSKNSSLGYALIVKNE